MGVLLRFLPQILTIVPEVVQLVEKLLGGGGNGSTKRDIVVALVKDTILAAEGLSGKDIADEALFSAGIGSIIDGVVDVFKATKHPLNF